jgi:hypothetical protein
MRFLVIVEHVNLALSRNRKEEVYGLFAGSDTDISDAKSTFFGSASVPISESGKINLGNISNTELLKIIDENLIKIEKLNEFSNFILEIDKEKTTFSTLKVV